MFLGSQFHLISSNVKHELHCLHALHNMNQDSSSVDSSDEELDERIHILDEEIHELLCGSSDDGIDEV